MKFLSQIHSVRGQSALEYLLLVGGAVLISTITLLIIFTSSSGTEGLINENLDEYSKLNSFLDEPPDGPGGIDLDAPALSTFSVVPGDGLNTITYAATDPSNPVVYAVVRTTTIGLLDGLTTTDFDTPQGGVTILPIGTSPLVDDSLTNGTAYYYRLRACDSAAIPNCVLSTTLEGMPASVSSGGWAIFSPSTDTQFIYVSSSAPGNCQVYTTADMIIGGVIGPDPFQPNGSPSGSGIIPGACSTIAAGRNLLRDTHPDWLLLKKGDTWNETLSGWVTSGRSISEPAVISGYGTGARPKIDTGSNNGISQCSEPTISNVSFSGIHLHSSWSGNLSDPNPPTAIRFVCGKKWVNGLFEDMEIEGYSNAFTIQGSPAAVNQNIILSRNLIYNNGATCTSPSSICGMGLYTENTDGLTLQENVFYHNGWKFGSPAASTFSHNIYIQNGLSTNDVVVGNMINDGSNYGIHLRTGGILANNLFYGNRVSMGLGGGQAPELNPNVQLDVRDNVILNGLDTWGISMSNIEGGIVQDNIITQSDLPIPIQISSVFQGSKVKNLTFTENVVYNSGDPADYHGIYIEGGSSQMSNVVFTNNDFQITNFNPTLNGSVLVYHSTSSSFPSITSGGNRFYAPLGNQNSLFGWATTNFSNLVGWQAQLVDSPPSIMQQAVYPDPNRNISTYMASLGFSDTSYSNFMTQVLANSKESWDPRFTADAVNEYIRTGFGK